MGNTVSGNPVYGLPLCSREEGAMRWRRYSIPEQMHE